MADNVAIYQYLTYLLLIFFAAVSIALLIYAVKNKDLHKKIGVLSEEKQNEKNRADQAEAIFSQAEVMAELLNELNSELVRVSIPILAILDLPTNRIFFQKNKGGNPTELPLVIEYDGKYILFQSEEPKQSLKLYYLDDLKDVAEQIINHLSLINPDFKAYKPESEGEDKLEKS